MLVLTEKQVLRVKDEESGGSCGALACRGEGVVSGKQLIQPHWSQRQQEKCVPYAYMGQNSFSYLESIGKS